MEPFKEMYCHLFNKVTDAVRLLEKERSSEARELLATVQTECEEIYISGFSTED